MPQKLNDAQKLAVVAFLLERNGVSYGGELSANNASKLSLK